MIKCIFCNHRQWKRKVSKEGLPRRNMGTQADNLKWALPSLFIKILDYHISPYHKVQCLCKAIRINHQMKTILLRLFFVRVFQKACKRAAIRTIPRDSPLIGLNTTAWELWTPFLIARNFAGNIPGCEVIVKIIRWKRQITENLFLEIFCFFP